MNILQKFYFVFCNSKNGAGQEYAILNSIKIENIFYCNISKY